MKIHNYKLRMLVDGVAHDANITFNSALDNVFNKRKKRIRDYGSEIYPSNSNTLSGYMTNGVGITNDVNIPLIPKDTNFIWKGYRHTDYTNISGTIGKVVLMCERIVRENNSNFYTVSNDVLFPSTVVGQNIGSSFGEHSFLPIALDEDGETLICISNDESTGYNLKDIYATRIKLNDMRWGLDGLEGGSAYKRGIAFSNDYRTDGTAFISKSLLNHGYTTNSDAKAELFDVDEDTESETFDDVTVSYDTWNCFLNCRNDWYGQSAGTSITQDEDYIYIFEYLLGAVIRIGQYNDPQKPYSQYAFKPQNCDYFYNMSTKKLEGLGNVQFQPLLNYAVIRKADMEVVQENQLFLSNTFAVDCSILDYTGSLSSTKDTQIEITEANMDPQIIQDNGYPFRAFAACADNDYIYFQTGTTSHITGLYRLKSSNIQGETLPESLTLEQVSTGNITNFCHTINRKNLFTIASLRTGDSGNMGRLVNKQTGIVNWIGFIDWMISAEADFGGVQVTAGQTVKFELIEEVIDEA